MPSWQEALNRAKRLALSNDEVSGVDYGFVYRDGRRTQQLGIRFHLRKKLLPTEVPLGNLLPKSIRGVRADVVEARYQPHAGPRDAVDPLRPGISIGNLTRTTTGTLGLIVEDLRDGARSILSNWHVLCGSTECRPGEEICQPGPLHAGLAPARSVAMLNRWADLGHGLDAAIARIETSAASADALFGTDTVLGAIAEPTVGQRVMKMGVASGLTYGMIDGTEGAYRLDYSDYGDTPRWMDGLRVIPDPDHPEEEISLGGDSGAIWFDAATHVGLALHFAGEDARGPLAQYALAHRLVRVFGTLDIRLP
jgi:hypothetical protein